MRTAPPMPVPNLAVALAAPPRRAWQRVARHALPAAMHTNRLQQPLPNHHPVFQRSHGCAVSSLDMRPAVLTPPKRPDAAVPSQPNGKKQGRCAPPAAATDGRPPLLACVTQPDRSGRVGISSARFFQAFLDIGEVVGQVLRPPCAVGIGPGQQLGYDSVQTRRHRSTELDVRRQPPCQQG